MDQLMKALRKFFVLIIGSTCLLFGAIMLITPGPGILIILLGLSVLATEFTWARITLKKVKNKTYDTSRGLYKQLCNPKTPRWLRGLCGIPKDQPKP